MSDTRGLVKTPGRITVPPTATEPLPEAEQICSGQRSPQLPQGGETAGRQILRKWLAGPIHDHEQSHDDLAGPRYTNPGNWTYTAEPACTNPDRIIDLRDGADFFRTARDENR